MISTTGRLPHVFALSQRDITPYGNGLYHSLNSILQPATASTKAPVVGVAVTTETTVRRLCHRLHLEDPGGCRTVYAGGSQGLWKWSVLLLR